MNFVSKGFIVFVLGFVNLLGSHALADAKVMNPGTAVGQMIVLSAEDVLNESTKFKSLNPLSIPVFAEMPLDMSVVAGAITLKQQNLLSHVQLKSRARQTPNLDISALEGGLKAPLFAEFQDGSWIRLELTAEGGIQITKATEVEAIAAYEKKASNPVRLEADTQTSKIFRTEELRSPDFVRVGSKAANYGELANLLNSASRTVVRPGFGIPFFYYQEFIDQNPKIKIAIESILRDPLMNRVAKVSYRQNKLKALQDLMTSPEAIVNQELLNRLVQEFDEIRFNGLPRQLKLRSSTNSEDLPNFNGAGLYDSYSYKPLTKEGKEKSLEKKRENLKESLQKVWASVWNLRAFDERAFFRIPHGDVRMGIQVNPSFANEGADGVVVTKNMAGDARFPGTGVYIEVQRGSEHSVANPKPSVKPMKILVLIDDQNPLERSRYQIQILQQSNVGDDNTTLLPEDNPNPVMTQDEIRDLTLQVLKAQAHFGPVLDPGNSKFSLDLEFKVDSEDTGTRQVYIKQARPYLD